MYQVINTKTGRVVGTYKTRERASRMVDKKDNEYGAYIHTIKFIGV